MRRQSPPPPAAAQLPPAALCRHSCTTAVRRGSGSKRRMCATPARVGRRVENAACFRGQRHQAVAANTGLWVCLMCGTLAEHTCLCKCTFF